MKLLNKNYDDNDGDVNFGWYVPLWIRRRPQHNIYN
jgi:hypothetical protein